MFEMARESVGMAVSTAAKMTIADEVAAAMRDAATAAPKGKFKGEPPASADGSDPLQWLSRMTYTGSYALSYGLVYAAAFIAQSLPQENAMMRGLRDGGREAAEQLSDG